MDDSRINIGIIGSGFIARTHAHSITTSLRHAQLTGIAGGSRASVVANEFSTQCFRDPLELVSNSAVDAVIIATPHHLHKDHALLAAEHGKHVLVEKPMALSVGDCLSIIEACRNNGVKLMVAFTQRYRTTNRMAHDIIRSGKIGSVMMIQEQALVPNGSSAFPHWQQSKENLGFLFGYGVHNIDRLRWFLQDDPSSISAQLNRNENGIDTSTMATIRWRKGALTNLWNSVDIPTPGFENTAFRSLIVGETGMLDVDGYGALRLSQGGSDWNTLYIQPPIDWQGRGMLSEVRMMSFNSQNQAFVDSVLDNVEPPISGLDGLRAVEIALAIYRAADSNISFPFS
jgi:predicted dehydrogenase